MPTVTVLTPTYNRAELLKNLYESLMRQTSYDFIWMIVDDGSSDHTNEVVRNFIAQAAFETCYLHKENGGKHTAINVGIAEVKTPLTVIVDSDDILLPNGIETILQYQLKYEGHPGLCGFSFLKVTDRGEPLLSLPKKEFVESHIKCRIKRRLNGDMAEVFYSDILKKYPFPEFSGEKFLSEDIVWISMGEKYQLVFVNQPIYQCEYLEKGLTQNDKRLKFASPYGSMLRGKKLMISRCGWVSWIRGAIIYDCYNQEIKKCSVLPEILQLHGLRCRGFALFMKPAGCFFNRHWKKSIC